MTRDGRTSPLHDIRLYRDGRSALEDRATWAFARRLVWWLNGTGFYIRHGPSLNIVFTDALPPSSVEVEAPR